MILSYLTTVISHSDCRFLQRQLMCLMEWCNGNTLDVNVEKYKVIIYRRKIDPIAHPYEISSAV